MTDLLVVVSTIALLVLALEPAHRRQLHAPKPGEDIRLDTDRERIAHELRVASQRDAGTGPTSQLRPTGSAAARTHLRGILGQNRAAERGRSVSLGPDLAADQNTAA